MWGLQRNVAKVLFYAPSRLMSVFLELCFIHPHPYPIRHRDLTRGVKPQRNNLALWKNCEFVTLTKKYVICYQSACAGMQYGPAFFCCHGFKTAAHRGALYLRAWSWNVETCGSTQFTPDRHKGQDASLPAALSMYVTICEHHSWFSMISFICFLFHSIAEHL